MGELPLVILPSGESLEPLGDAAAQALILTRPLAEVQDEEARAAGFVPQRVVDLDSLPPGPLVLVRDNALFTRELLRAVRQRAMSQAGVAWAPGRLVLAPGPLTRFLAPLQNLADPAPESEGREQAERVGHAEEAAPSPAACGDDGKDTAGSSAGALFHHLWVLDGQRPVHGRLPTRPLVVEPGEEVFRFPVQRALEPSGELVFPFTPLFFLEISHWLHVLRGNLAALLGVAARAAHHGGLWGLLRLVIGARSFNRHRLLARASRIAAGCDVHPSAVVEGSFLAEGASVGAHALVRFSVLGRGARVGDGAQVVASVLGEQASVSRTACLMGSVLYPGAGAGPPGLQLSLLGRDALQGGMALIGDVNLEGNVQVWCRGGLMDSGSRFLGCCLGHGAVAAFGAALAPGRVLPNGCRLIGSPQQVATRIPADLPQGKLLWVEQGRVVDPGRKS